MGYLAILYGAGERVESRPKEIELGRVARGQSGSTLSHDLGFGLRRFIALPHSHTRPRNSLRPPRRRQANRDTYNADIVRV